MFTREQVSQGFASAIAIVNAFAGIFRLPLLALVGRFLEWAQDDEGFVLLLVGSGDDAPAGIQRDTHEHNAALNDVIERFEQTERRAPDGAAMGLFKNHPEWDGTLLRKYGPWIMQLIIGLIGTSVSIPPLPQVPAAA